MKLNIKKLKSNKKGFTLVELLAVIVILALLIIITANTVLPMMNKTKKSAMVTYAGRVVSNALANYQADNLTSGTSGAATKYYSIETIMGTADYFGCVEVTSDGKATPTLTVTVKMFDKSNKLFFNSSTTGSTFTGDVETIVKEYTANVPDNASYVTTDSGLCTSAKFSTVAAP